MKRKSFLKTAGCNLSGALGRGPFVTNRGNKFTFDNINVDFAALNDAPLNVSCGWGHSSIVTEKGKLIVCGRAIDVRNALRMGSFGMNYPSVADFSTKWMFYRSIDYVKPTLILDLPNKKVTSTVSSAAFTLILFDDLSIAGFGYNRFGQVGVNKPNPEIFEPYQIELETPIVKCAAGFQHSLALDAKENVYAWGKINLDKENLVSSSPKLIIEASNVVDIACGLNFSVLLKKNGDLIIILHKTGEKHLIADGSLFSINVPIKNVYSGKNNMFTFVDHAGQIFLVDLSNNSKLALLELKPRKVKLPESLLTHAPLEIKQITMSLDHSLARFSNGTCISWANPKNNNSNDHEIRAEIHEFVGIEMNDQVVDVSFGWNHRAIIVSSDA